MKRLELDLKMNVKPIENFVLSCANKELLSVSENIEAKQGDTINV